MHLTTSNDEITDYLYKIKKCIEEDENNLKIQTNRDINLNFMIKYGLNRKEIVKIIKMLCVENYKDKVINEHKNYSNEILYIFSKDIELIDIHGKKRMVTLYIKFNLLNSKVILISFHEAKYKFKEK